MVSHNFLGSNFFFGWTPTWSETVIYWGFGPFWAAGTQRNSENRKTQFRGLGALLGGKSVCRKKFSQKLRNFFTFCVVGQPDPQGRESQNTGLLGPFGPGQPLALREIPGGKQKSTTSRCFFQEQFWGGDPAAPKVSPRNCATFFRFPFWPTGLPRAGNREILVFEAIVA